MKNFGISVFDISTLDGALRISLGGVWFERKGLKDGRSLLAVEIEKTQVSCTPKVMGWSITLDIAFMRFMFER